MSHPRSRPAMTGLLLTAALGAVTTVWLTDCVAAAPTSSATGNPATADLIPGEIDFRARVRTFDQLPQQLLGPWRITLCLRGNHAWLRFDSLDTGVVHTLGRYRQGWADQRNADTHHLVVPAAPVSGVLLDQDLYSELHSAHFAHHTLTMVVENPVIFRGRDHGRGYGVWTNNCTTFARDAWHFYGGTKYRLLWPHVPADLFDAIRRDYQQRQPAMNSGPVNGAAQTTDQQD